VEATLVFYMPVGSLRAITTSLTALGRDEREPAILLGRAGTAGERVLAGRLGQIAEDARAALFTSPAVLITGPTVAAASVPRPFRRADVRGARLVIAATGAPGVDAAVAAEARRRRALVNVVDHPAECDVILPSVLRRGPLQIAVSTGGRSPALAREIRRRLERVIGPEYAALVERVGAARDRARALAADPRARLAAGERVVASALAAVGRARAPCTELP